MNFIALCLIHKEEPENIDAYIEQWHTLPDNGVSLPDFLGFTKEEYAYWVTRPTSTHASIALYQILRCR